MAWVRMHPFVTNWPGGGGPPVFEINADGNGTAVVELAWDPQALAAPASYADPLRYWSSDRGSAGVPGQTITLTGNRATFVMPAALWAAYGEETLKSVSSPPRTTFARTLYYRVRVTPPGSATADVWPPDTVLAGDAAQAPHIGILPVSGSATAGVVPDTAAVKGLGGIAVLAPTLWSDLLTALWRDLPEADPSHRSLVAVFAHPVFRSAPLALRTDLLRLWLFAAKMRLRIPDLLGRQVVTGSGVTQPVITKTALRGGRTFVGAMLDLLAIRPHPDLGAVTREDLVDDVLREVLDPHGQLNQGFAGTCAPTTIQTMLLTANPAEYVRLVTGLLSATGRVELANGTTADLPRGVLAPARYTTPFTLPDGTTVSATNIGFAFRTFAEMAFQCTMIKFGKGATFPADDGTETAARRIFATCYRDGLLSTEAEKVLEAVFNVGFTCSPLAWPTSAPTFTATQQALVTSLTTLLTTRKQPVLLGTFWGKPEPWVQPPPGVNPGSFYGGHATLALRHEGGRVFVKNPQYSAYNPGVGAANGGTAADPARRYEDVSASLESFTESDLARWIYFHISPDTAIV